MYDWLEREELRPRFRLSLVREVLPRLCGCDNIYVLGLCALERSADPGRELLVDIVDTDVEELVDTDLGRFREPE